MERYVLFLTECLIFNLPSAGLTISAFARGYQVLDEKHYLERALRAAHFVRNNLYIPSSSRLRRSAYRESSG